VAGEGCPLLEPQGEPHMPNGQMPKSSNAAHALLGKLYSDASKKGPDHAVDVKMSVADVGPMVEIGFNFTTLRMVLSPEQALGLATIIANHAKLAHEAEEKAKNPAGLILPEGAME